MNKTTKNKILARGDHGGSLVATLAAGDGLFGNAGLSLN
jgi:hypothetical protein